ncbi:MAG: hypothetical protein PHV68_07700, partial [Candidatus Gastranaerophilales bacterium]|nr:hypothetical protein [Candidatus Gastranaerophilales bacterium]
TPMQRDAPQQSVYQSIPPTTAAVNIQMIEPRVIPAMPQNPIHNYPQASLYAQPQMPTPYMMPQQQIPYMAPQQIQPQAPYMIPQQQIQPQAIPQSIVSQTPVPPPPVVETTPATAEPVKVVPQAEQTATTTPAEAIDVNGINAKLNGTNLDDQTAVIQEIAKIGQSEPDKAKTLLNETTFKSLSDVIVKDNNNLPGPKEGQTVMSDWEKAEMNRQYGTYTLAVLQKNFREAIDAEAKTQGVPSIAVNELPEIDKIVGNLKSDKNPIIREASVSALSYLARPEDKELLNPIFELVAKEDADNNVKEAAKAAMEKLNTPA